MALETPSDHQYKSVSQEYSPSAYKMPILKHTSYLLKQKFQTFSLKMAAIPIASIPDVGMSLCWNSEHKLWHHQW